MAEAPQESAGSRSAPEPKSFEDLLLPSAVSGLVSLLLQELEDLQGWQRVGAGTVLGLVLWSLVRRRRGEPLTVPQAFRRSWAASLVGTAAVAVLALGVTALAFGRPTVLTAVLAVAALAALLPSGVRGRPVAGAGVAALSGGVVGLCLAVVLSG